MKESSSIPIFWGFYFEKPAAILQGALQLLLTSRLSERSKREEKKVFLGAHQDRVLTIVENMTETKVEVESPADPRTFCNPPQDNRQKLDPMGTRRELEESLLLLADVALAPPCGRDASCSCLEVRQAGLGLQCSQQQLQGFLKKVEHLRDCLVSRNSHLEKQALAAAVTTLLYTCQPFFRRLESTARSPTSKPSHLSAETGLLSDGAGVRFLTSALCASAAAGLLSAALRASGAAAADLRQIRDSVRGRGRAQQRVTLLHRSLSARTPQDDHFPLLQAHAVPVPGRHRAVQTHALERGASPGGCGRRRGGGGERPAHGLLLPLLRRPSQPERPGRAEGVVHRPVGAAGSRPPNGRPLRLDLVRRSWRRLPEASVFGLHGTVQLQRHGRPAAAAAAAAPLRVNQQTERVQKRRKPD
ncbi:UPF0575 protein C19orf67 homolog isoform X4 [Oryzias latipes]